MTSKKYLSNKRTSQQTISISPALKDWIQRYVSVQHEKNPNHNAFRSISSFYSEVMEKIMDIFRKGGSIDDLDKTMSKNISPLDTDDTIIEGFAPVFEIWLELNRYANLDFKKSPNIYYALKKVQENILKELSIEDFKFWFVKLQNFFLSNNFSTEIELNQEKGSKHIIGFLSHRGQFKNISFQNFKNSAIIAGFLGIEITDATFSMNIMSCRLDMKTTDLFFNINFNSNKEQDDDFSARVELIHQNLQHITNFMEVVNDEDHYLWLKMAKDKGVSLCFSDALVRQKWVEMITNDFRRFGDKEDFPINLLKFFEKLHWISIENSNDLTFRIKLTRDKNNDDLQFLLGYLGKYSKISREGEKYYLE